MTAAYHSDTEARGAISKKENSSRRKAGAAEVKEIQELFLKQKMTVTHRTDWRED